MPTHTPTPSTPPPIRYRVTVRSDAIELRGHVTGQEAVEAIAAALNGTALVCCSVASDPTDDDSWVVTP